MKALTSWAIYANVFWSRIPGSRFWGFPKSECQSSISLAAFLCMRPYRDVFCVNNEPAFSNVTLLVSFISKTSFSNQYQPCLISLIYFLCLKSYSDIFNGMKIKNKPLLGGEMGFDCQLKIENLIHGPLRRVVSLCNQIIWLFKWFDVVLSNCVC